MSADPEHFDLCIVGAGVAGLSLAARLGDRRRVVVIDGESHIGAHATGRSAALFTTTYGDRVVRELTVASAGFFHHPPAGFADAPLLKPRGCLYAARPTRTGALVELAREVAMQCPDARLHGPGDFVATWPPLEPEFAASALIDPAAADIDVHALTSGFLRVARAAGAEVRTQCRLVGADSSGGAWTLATTDGEIVCDRVVNAAGAWADEVALMLGAAPLGLQPRRRTMVCIEAPAGCDPQHWPFTVDLDMSLYFKPDAGRIILSPADETPSPPCDAQAEELDVAIAIDRFESATGLAVRRVVSRWAGLRTFARDERPVVGPDTAAPGVFWLAGQGGFGVQTAPALAALAAALLLGDPVPDEVAARGIEASELSPRRLAAGG